MSNDELYHYGVKGMRWGHRKAIDETDPRYISLQKKKAAMLDRKRNFKEAKREKKRAGSDLAYARYEVDEYLDPDADGLFGLRRATMFAGRVAAEAALYKLEADYEETVAKAKSKKRAYKTAKKEYKTAKKEFKQSLKLENQ